MIDPVSQKILSRCEPARLVGRELELERLLAAAAAGESLTILVQPSSGATELLRQAYDRLFREQEAIIPIYFELRRTDEDVRAVAARFAHEFLMQTVAFRLKAPLILSKAPSLDELSRLAPVADSEWMDEALEALGRGHGLTGRAFVRNCLGIPVRAISRGSKVMLLIDAAGIAGLHDGGDSFVLDIYALAASVPLVLAGHRRFLYKLAGTPLMRLGNLAFEPAGRLCTSLADLHGVTTNEQTRDLIAVQLGGDPSSMSRLFSSAADKNISFDNFEQVQRVYTDEIAGGRIGRHLEDEFSEVFPDRASRVAFISSLAPGDAVSIKYLSKLTSLDGDTLTGRLARLNDAELIDIVAGTVTLSPSHLVRDYAAVVAGLENGGTRAAVIGETLARNIRRAPSLMADMYRRLVGLDLSALLNAFDGQDVSTAALDSERFSNELRGVDDERALGILRGDDTRMTLPKIAFTSDAIHYYPKLSDLDLSGTPVVGIGFEPDGRQIAIIAGEIESKLAATRGPVDFWCDRFEMLAVASGLENYRVWLIAPEGFDQDALAALAERGAYGSSRRQIELLARLLDAPVTTSRPQEEFEMVLPMGEDTEMISARAVEDIARRHGLSTKAINQVKTALVEACINATEHSKSPDRKIYQKFVVENGRLLITVANRGVRLADRLPDESSGDEQRRGWGLQLMRKLMDDVRVESTDDGTRITLVKNLDR